jgi:ribosomal protein S12 methylthiotransferase accessory factor
MIQSTWVNRGYEALGYRLPDADHRSLTELLSMYNHIGGPVRKLATYFGHGNGLRVNVGHSAYSDLDRILQRLARSPSLDLNTRTSLYGGGKGFHLPDMVLASLGEGVERFVGSLAMFLSARTRWGTRSELTAEGLTCLSPAELPLFADEQYADPGFPYEPFTDDSWLGWLEGERLRSGQSVWVPGQIVEMLHLYHPDEAVIGYAVSGGLSCHASRDLALCHGITELAERDAINLRWYLGVRPDMVVLDRESALPAVRHILDDLARIPGRTVILHHSLDLTEIPVLTIIQIDEWMHTMSYNAGGGADVDIDRALLKALTEFGQSDRTMRLAFLCPEWTISKAIDRMFLVGPDATVEQMTNFIQAIGFYGHRTKRDKLTWYLTDNPPLPVTSLPTDPTGTPADRLRFLLDVLDRRLGADPICFDFGPPGLRQLALLKVFIPELTFPFFQSRPMLGHPRFARMAALAGVETPGGRPRINPDPLPYP